VKTIIAKEIDGLRIVVGFDRPVIDAIATKKAVEGLINETSEYQAYIAAKSAAEQDVAIIGEAWQAVLNKQREIVQENAIYFTPKTDETIISSEEAETLKAQFEALPEKTVLVIDEDENGTLQSNELVDHRGEVYWTRDVNGIWRKETVMTLGETLPIDSTLPEELTPEQWQEIVEQIEQARIDALSTDERNQEFEEHRKTTRREAIFMKEELIMDGVGETEALSQAWAWSDNKLAELRTRYNIV